MNNNEFKKIKDVTFNEKVSMILKFQNVVFKKTTTNADYASLLGYDGEELIEVKIWSIPKNKKDILKNGEVYYVVGSIKDYQGKKQLNVNDYDLVGEDFDRTRFYQTAPLDRHILEKKINYYIDKIDNEILKKVVKSVLDEYYEDFYTFPAATTIHHAYLSGLAFHTYSMLTLANSYLDLYSFLNRSLVISGIILHDIGKIIELGNAYGPEYTAKGNLLGHISIGYNIISKAFEKLGFHETEECLLLSHIILAHHGKLEFGSPKEPVVAEAFLIYLLDFADSRLSGLETVYENTPKGEITEQLIAFERKNFYIPNI